MILIYKVLFREERCKGCTLCETFCPKKIISMSDRVNELGYYVAQISKDKDCIGCGFCFRMCPDSVITIVNSKGEQQIEEIDQRM